MKGEFTTSGPCPKNDGVRVNRKYLRVCKGFWKRKRYFSNTSIFSTRRFMSPNIAYRQNSVILEKLINLLIYNVL